MSKCKDVQLDCGICGQGGVETVNSILSIVFFALANALFALAAKIRASTLDRAFKRHLFRYGAFRAGLALSRARLPVLRVRKTVADEDEHCRLHVTGLASGTHCKLGKTLQIALASKGSDASGRGCLIAAHRQVELPFGLGTIIAAPDPKTPVSDRIAHAERWIGSLNQGHSPMAFQHSEHTQRHNETPTTSPQPNETTPGLPSKDGDELAC